MFERRLVSLFVAIAVAIAATSTAAHADNKSEAKQLLARAAQAFKESRWQDAVDALNQAYALDPKPELFFSLAQVYVKLDRCEDAIIQYEQFLASKPNRVRANAATEAIAKCKETIAARAPDAPVLLPDPEPEKPPPPPPPPPVVQPRVVDSPAWYRDRLAVGLLATGTATVVAGALVYMSARSSLTEADGASTYATGVDAYADARTMRTASVLLIGGGVMLAGLGVYRVIDRRLDRPRLMLVPTAGGGMATWTSGF